MHTLRSFVILSSCMIYLCFATSCSIMHKLFSSRKATHVVPAATAAVPQEIHPSVASGPSNLIQDEMVLYDTLQQHVLHFRTYAARLKVNFMQDDEAQNLVVNMRMQSDSLIWMNATALLGIEVARALITPDSIWFINRLKRTYYQKSFQEIAEWIGVPVNFRMLQNLLVGNPVFLSDTITGIQADTASVCLTMLADSMVNRLWITFPALRWQRSELMIPYRISSITDTSLARPVVQYFYADSLQLYPSGWQLQVNDSQHTTLQVDIQNVIFNQSLSFPFFVPAHYTTQR